MIRTSYDPEAEAMFVWFGEAGGKSAGTEEVAPGIMLDFDAEGRMIGIEILDVLSAWCAQRVPPSGQGETRATRRATARASAGVSWCQNREPTVGSTLDQSF
jgi:uncharacterized protein YuzE